MSTKCKYCHINIFDETGMAWGEELDDGTWACYYSDCREQMLENIRNVFPYSSDKVSSISCCLCGGVVIEYSLPNDIWNKVIRVNGVETDKEYLCVQCFFDALRKSLNIEI